MNTDGSFSELPESVNKLSGSIVDCAYRVHKRLGPGLLESVYEMCLEHEIKKTGIRVERQASLPLVYDSLRIDNAFRVDLWVDRRVVVEIKAVETLEEIHEAQLLTYLKLTENRLGLLLNFNSRLMRDGIVRRIF